MSEECDYRAQWDRTGLWQVCVKMEEFAQVHTGRFSAAVTCASVSATFGSITLKVEHRRSREALNIHKCLSDFDVRPSVLLPFQKASQLAGRSDMSLCVTSYRFPLLPRRSVHGRRHLHLHAGAVGEVFICTEVQRLIKARSCRRLK